jgi:hypothetical protein
MRFEEKQLSDIRDRLKVSEVVGSYWPIIKKGAEYVAKENDSFTINDKKQFWCEFGAGGDGKPHDIFAFMQTYGGLTFPEAVEECARRAGVRLEQRTSVSDTRSNGHDSLRSPDDDGRESTPVEAYSAGSDASAAKPKREVTASWDYRDPENNLLYQVVRMQEKLPDGSWKQKNGKTAKTFMHRRPSPDNDGTWILGLDVIDREKGVPLEFIRTPHSQAWMRATEERLQWRGIERRTFEQIGNVEHWLFNANEVLDELQEPREDQRTIFMPEGEGKVDVLKEWGLLGITNSAGAKHFTPACAEFFRGARQVVILVDNDRAGIERVAKIAPMLKAVDVETVQALNFRDVWPKCPVKGDIKDWRDHGDGTREQLLEIIDGLKPWEPEPYRSKFGAKTFRDLTAKASAYPWRIKHLVPMNDDVLIMGPSRSGKTFEALDMTMHCHFGKPFANKKVIECGMVYLTYEGASGFENRLRAYLLHHGLKDSDLHSFAWITRPPGLYASEDNVVALSEEINELAKGFRNPLGFTVVDTHNSATRGSSEIKSEDIDKILTRYQILKEKTVAPLWIIGHTNADGKHRGNEQFFNGIETALLVQRVQEHKSGSKQLVDMRDDEGRVRRRVSVNKQREENDGVSWDFVLDKVKIGVDDDGDDITSMVSIEPAERMPENAEELSGDGKGRPSGVWLNDTQVSQFQALLRAIEEVGEVPPAELQLPKSVARVITTGALGKEWRKKVPQGDGEEYAKYMARTKQALRRFAELTNKKIIGIDQIDRSTADNKNIVHFVWPTGRIVRGRGFTWPVQSKKKESPKPLLAPGEDEKDSVF